MYQNKVTLIGFLGNDAEVHTANERSFTTFSLATKSSYKDKKSGEYVSHTEWHRCVVFSRLSEFAGTLTKGTHVQVEGELRSREYTPKKAAGSKSKKVETKQRIWEIRVASILKLDRAEKAAPEDQEQDDNTGEDAAF
jgi:single-strand DNA-binding protein